MSEPGTNVLILSSDYGEGHQQVAEAIRQALQAQHPSISARIVNIVSRLHPRFHPIGRSVFIQTVKKAPALYGYLYRKTYRPTASSQMLNGLSRFGLKRLQRLLEEEQPAVVVSTFPFATGAMSMLRARQVTDVPTVTVITDHTVHRAWIQPLTSCYIVGSEPVRAGLLANDVPAQRIAVTGIPLRPAFSHTYDKQMLRFRHGLRPDLPTVLLMGGGFGVFGEGMFDLAELEALPMTLQMVVIAGHNEKVRAFLEQEMRSSHHQVVIKGYVHHIHEWMAMSDLIITKPGGVSTSEAMALEVPMLLYKPLPGQEEENLRFLVQAGVAKSVAPGQTLTAAMLGILHNPPVLYKMQRSAQSVGRKHAAQDAAAVILQIAKKPHMDTPADAFAKRSPRVVSSASGSSQSSSGSSSSSSSSSSS